MKNIMILLFGLFTFFGNAQNDKAAVDKMVSEFTKSLENRNINKYFYMNTYCLGTTEMFKLKDGSMCISKGTYYQVFILWKEEGQAMVKKIDNCGMYFSLPLPTSELIDFVEENHLQLKEGIVKKYEVENPENVPLQRSKVHSCLREFQFTNETHSFGQRYNLYDLTDESKFKNLNFESNNKLKIVSLEKLLSNTISKMEPDFRRQN